jgi:hypothetical protein
MDPGRWRDCFFFGLFLFLSLEQACPPSRARCAVMAAAHFHHDGRRTDRLTVEEGGLGDEPEEAQEGGPEPS